MDTAEGMKVIDEFRAEQSFLNAQIISRASLQIEDGMLTVSVANIENCVPQT